MWGKIMRDALILEELSTDVTLSDFDGIRHEVLKMYHSMFKDYPIGAEQISTVFDDVKDLFEGRYHGYQACDTKYHNIEHTLQETLAHARILYGLNKFGHIDDGHSIIINSRLFTLSMISSMLHDSGYIKKTGDDEGTGGKYTLTHIARSCEFAREYMEARGYGEEEIVAAQQMIQCTGIDPHPREIHFASNREKIAGFALGTADLLSQMAAANYLNKLPELYREFEEGKVSGFDSADDLIAKTPDFYRKIVMMRFNDFFEGVYWRLNFWVENGSKLYFDAIDKNIGVIESGLHK